jgi:hypothetical protein
MSLNADLSSKIIDIRRQSAELLKAHSFDDSIVQKFINAHSELIQIVKAALQDSPLSARRELDLQEAESDSLDAIKTYAPNRVDDIDNMWYQIEVALKKPRNYKITPGSENIDMRINFMSAMHAAQQASQHIVNNYLLSHATTRREYDRLKDSLDMLSEHTQKMQVFSKLS